jgi:hypothetical protein
MGKKLNERAKKENFLSKENKKSCWHMIPDEVNFCEFFYHLEKVFVHFNDEKKLWEG